MRSIAFVCNNTHMNKAQKRHIEAKIAGMKARLELKRKAYSVELVEAKPRVKQALGFARLAHAGQKRKYDGGDYIDHPIEVANILIAHKFLDEAYLVPAVLHDVLEDTHATEEQIQLNFGTLAARHVEALTVKSGSRERKKQLKIDKAIAAGPIPVAVKIADIISNISDVALYDPEFASIYLEEKKEALDAFKASGQLVSDNHRALLKTAYDTYAEGLNQLALTVLAEENERVADEAQSQAEIESIIFDQQVDQMAEYALF